MPRSISQALKESPPENILLIRPSALGDVCRTVPVLATLKAEFPGAKIDWVVQDVFVDAIAGHPALHRPVLFPRKEVSISKWHTSHARKTLRGFLRVLRAARYDLVLDCQGLGRSGIFALWTGSKRRVGYSDAGEYAWLGANYRIQAPGTMHTVDRMLALVEAMGLTPARDMRLYTPGGVQAAVPDFETGGYIVVAPTSRWTGKRWADDRYQALIQRLLEAHDRRIVIVGGMGERVQCPGVLQLAAIEDRVIDLVGKTSIAQLMHTIQHAALLVANDSAALHMAVGFECPAVALFGPTRTDLVGPYRRDADVIQHAPTLTKNSHKDERVGRAYMDAITVEEVFAACLHRLERS